MELEILRWMQSFSHPVLDVVAQLLTMLGEPVTIAVVFCGIYWCYDKELGRSIILTMSASLCLNGALKDFFAVERPIGKEGIVSQRVETATGYSFPSGHTQAAAAFWTPIFLTARRFGLRILSVVIIVTVGLSRMYLGVHYLSDVLGGLLFGALTACVFHAIHRRKRYWVAVIICGVLAVTAFFTGDSHDTYKAAGLAVGALAGFGFEYRFVRFTVSGSAKTKMLRYFMGLVILGVMYLLPKLLLPDTIIVGMIKYGLITFFGVGLYPWLFTKLKQ